MKLLVAAMAASAWVPCIAPAQPVYVVPEGVESRWASPENPGGEKGRAGEANAGRKGRASLPLKAGASLTLAEVRGASGMVRRIWATINDRSPRMLRGLRLDMFWDGAAKPAVSAPFGDFFGFGIGQTTTFHSVFFSSPEGRSFNCYIPMPFRTGMKIVVTNESGADLRSLFYDVDYTVGDRHPDGALYFHAHYRREAPTTLQRDYEILPKVAGKGRFLGANLGVLANQKDYLNTWWGEGEVKVYLDGDTRLPTLSGTGTEDYIGTGWGQGQYATLYQGCHFADPKTMRYCFYRYHLPDPVYFHKDIRVTIQQIGYAGAKQLDALFATGAPIYNAGAGLVQKEKSGGLFERQDDWSSCAYFYLERTANDLPAIDAAELRMRGLQ
jgi:hypothetical protein